MFDAVPTLVREEVAALRQVVKDYVTWVAKLVIYQHERDYVLAPDGRQSQVRVNMYNMVPVETYVGERSSKVKWATRVSAMASEAAHECRLGTTTEKRLVSTGNTEGRRRRV